MCKHRLRFYYKLLCIRQRKRFRYDLSQGGMHICVANPPWLCRRQVNDRLMQKSGGMLLCPFFSGVRRIHNFEIGPAQPFVEVIQNGEGKIQARRSFGTLSLQTPFEIRAAGGFRIGKEDFGPKSSLLSRQTLASALGCAIRRPRPSARFDPRIRFSGQDQATGD
jgi:hypothetical protein